MSIAFPLLIAASKIADLFNARPLPPAPPSATAAAVVEVAAVVVPLVAVLVIALVAGHWQTKAHRLSSLVAFTGIFRCLRDEVYTRPIDDTSTPHIHEITSEIDRNQFVITIAISS